MESLLTPLLWEMPIMVGTLFITNEFEIIGFLLADAAVLYNNIELLTSTKSSLIVIESMFLKFLSLKQKT